MNTSQFRQSYLDFFRSKGHEIVSSDSLLPRSPNLLFTNAGMNQFVPYFLGERKPACPRIADTQKCIRAGGKHNDLEDVGLDTYHQTFFEMLGNWSFGDYFKKDSIEWAWELLTKVWGFPKHRLYATVYKPGVGDPSEFDQEAHDIWKAIFEKEGMDPSIHICTSGKKDNFWMMGETGPCGPCSEVHIDLTPNGDTLGKLVNAGSPLCMEIWNLVFIQFNAEGNGVFKPLAAKHVDTGMGLERVAGIYATTKGFKDFSHTPSNYNSDVFAPIFARISQLSGKTYGALVPEDRNRMSADEQRDCAFRILADHIRTLSFSIADGILPGNEGRHYVLRRILRRGLLYGKRLNLPEGFFSQLVAPLVRSMGDFFPELKQQQETITKVISLEEEAFERTLGRGLQLFEKMVVDSKDVFSGQCTFCLYDTYGFPLDLTELLVRERGLSIDTAAFETEMEKQRERARAAQKKTAIRVKTEHARVQTEFTGYDRAHLDSFEATLVDIIESSDGCFVMLDKSPLYAEMGGQVGDTGLGKVGDQCFRIVDTIRDEQGTILHKLANSLPHESIGQKALISVDTARRRRIECHHTATHILHWALRRILGTHVQQKGSLVTPDYLRFDFSHFEAVSDEQLRAIEHLCNEQVLENKPVSTLETTFEKKPAGCLAFFGEKYGDTVRVIDVGGFSMELCGGTHVRQTGEIGLIKICQESAIAAGTRRMVAVAGLTAAEMAQKTFDTLGTVANLLACKTDEVTARVNHLLDHQKQLEKQIRAYAQKELCGQVDALLSHKKVKAGLTWVVAETQVHTPEDLKSLVSQVSQKIGTGHIVVLATVIEGNTTIVANCSSEAVSTGHKAGHIIQTLAQKLGGRGGGRPDWAMGGCKGSAGLQEALQGLE